MNCWRKVADLEQESYLRRNKYDQEYKEVLKQAYMTELDAQLKSNQLRKQTEKKIQIEEERRALFSTIELEKLRFDRGNSKMKNIQYQQQLQEAEVMISQQRKAELQLMEKKKEAEFQQQKIQAANLASYLQNYEESQKKREMTNTLMNSIQQNRERKAKQNMLERERQRQLLEEGERRKLQDEIKRIKFYHGLRERAKQVDYGSHSIISEQYEQEEAKKQQFLKINQQRRMQQLKQFVRQEQQKKRIRNRYSSEQRQSLKSQIEAHQRQRLKQMEEKQRQRKSIIQMASLSEMAQHQERIDENREKKILRRTLLEQAEQKKQGEKQKNQMSTIQYDLNRKILALNYNVRSSIDNYPLDYSRKKQYEILAKSCNRTMHVDQQEQ